MDTTRHAKHEELNRPSPGTFHRCEWAFTGAPCGEIKALVGRLARGLASQWLIGYADADHSAPNNEALPTSESGLDLAYTDKISFHRYDGVFPQHTHEWRSQFAGVDAVFANGNHFEATQQVVIVHPAKLESLQRKLKRLTGVDLVLLAEAVAEVPAFLKEQLAGAGAVPVFRIGEQERITAFFEEKLKAAVPPVKGLVLAGGRSRRMKQDKSLLEYHGVPQRDYIFAELRKVCAEVYLSCRPEQAATLLLEYPLLVDTFLNLGPMGAILSAFRQEPDTAWIVAACDLPLLDAGTLSFLMAHRNPSVVATAFKSPENEFPEPLIALWEPRAYPVLLSFLAQGYNCPRKVLINTRVALLSAPDPDSLRNANTPDEAMAIARLLETR